MKDPNQVAKNLRTAFDEMISTLQAARDAIDTPELYPARPRTSGTWRRAIAT